MKKRKKNVPNGPKGKWFSGHLNEFQADPLAFLVNLQQQYGDVAKFRFGPFQHVYLLSKPEYIKEVLVTKQRSFVKSQDLTVLKPLIGDGLLTSEKGLHLQQRRTIQPSFRQSYLAHYAREMIETTNNYIYSWLDEDVRDITEDMMNITLGIICKTMFSLSFEEGANMIGEPIDDVMKLSIKRMRSILPVPLFIPTKINRHYTKAIAELDEIIYSFIEQRREFKETHHDLLGVLMEAKDEQGMGMTDQQLRDEVMTIFLAGHETTANALSWTVYLLSQHPEIEQKVHQEIEENIGKEALTIEHYNKLPYTQNVIWESLRLYPPAYVIGRKADESVSIGPYEFKKGDMILMSQYVNHRNPHFFENPNEFMPERFENNLIKELPPFAFFPFGGGPRVCIGNHFAMMEAVFVLTAIARQFQFVLPKDHHPVKPQPLITLRPKRGLRMIVKRR
ncbi:cytochrome P450 [Alkalihalobacillus sp. LMS39]|uniref:cytochrome P450 n=1 Tax=Alkalihalobacillus sp. LMS39 TaxID=2924032 RepID=UPI001FB4851A|nr:cytochrome P450 [Alkalihalobacillus sp. LMS39]UOE95315.1 cytochrome P450 [Alkalihalobacillus sp. LMS39]